MFTNNVSGNGAQIAVLIDACRNRHLTHFFHYFFFCFSSFSISNRRTFALHCYSQMDAPFQIPEEKKRKKNPNRSWANVRLTRHRIVCRSGDDNLLQIRNRFLQRPRRFLFPEKKKHAICISGGGGGDDNWISIGLKKCRWCDVGSTTKTQKVLLICEILIKTAQMKMTFLHAFGALETSKNLIKKFFGFFPLFCKKPNGFRIKREKGTEKKGQIEFIRWW